jgi:hypothetical protein
VTRALSLAAVCLASAAVGSAAVAVAVIPWVARQAAKTELERAALYPPKVDLAYTRTRFPLTEGWAAE